MDIQNISYLEAVDISKTFKESYVKEIKNLINAREQAAVSARNGFIKDVFSDQERYREQFRSMLGWPLDEINVKVVPMAKADMLSEGENYVIYRVSVEVLKGFSMTGILFKIDDKKRPLVVAQHGGQGTPELISNFYSKKTNYNQMIERMLSYDVNVFAPQLLLWDQSYNVEYDRKALDSELKRVGSSITALECFGITRILDYFEAQPYVSTFGMIGLSYGGFYTLFTAAIDTRIRSAVSCSFFNNRKNYAWCDWTWFQSSETFSDAEIACLVYPRRLCIELGTKDEAFDINSARSEVRRLYELSTSVGTEWIQVVEFEGGHEFCWDDEPLKNLANDLWLEA